MISLAEFEIVFPRIGKSTRAPNHANPETVAVLRAMTPKELYAFDLAINYGCQKMAQTLWDRAKARHDERP